MFQTLFYQPVLNLLVFLYNVVPGHDFGLTIIAMVIVVNLLLWPLGSKALKSQKQMQDLQPRLDELKIKYKDDKEAYGRAVMELYKNEKVNPFGGCLPMLIQLPFFYAVFRVFRDELSGKALGHLLYPFIQDPGQFHTLAFGFLDLSQKNLYLAIITALAQFAKSKMMPMQKPAINSEASKDESMAVMMNKQMMIMGPFITFMACVNFPSGLAFYWLMFTLFSIGQQYYIFHSKKKDNQIKVEVSDIQSNKESKEEKKD